MKVKKIPLRTCVVTHEKLPKKELLRIVKDKEGNISLDKTGKMAGRGAYLCNDEKCLEKVIKTKRLEKVLEAKISDEVYESIRGVRDFESK